MSAADVRSMHAYVDAFEQSVRSLLEVVETLDEEQWRRPTECPGWTVLDQVAHVVALERQFLGEDAPQTLDDYGQHVRNGAGQHMEDGIAALRGLGPGALVEALRDALGRRLDALRATELDPAALTPGVLGNDIPVGRFWPVRVFDVWAHEQDVRRAVGRPGNLAGPAADVARDRVALALPYVVGRVVAPPPGTIVAFDVSGETPLPLTVSVGPDGRGSGVPGIAGSATATLRTDWETMSRLACGRIDPATAGVTVEGDAELGRRVLANLAVTP
ncbi:MAG: maleylpyruvate isomerase family mycothiol-dependent enzyme [Actinomycetes bacterium]